MTAACGPRRHPSGGPPRPALRDRPPRGAGGAVLRARPLPRAGPAAARGRGLTCVLCHVSIDRS
eukprot:5651649-Lingulodinium_polyedra.AAC.1